MSQTEAGSVVPGDRLETLVSDLASHLTAIHREPSSYWPQLYAKILDLNSHANVCSQNPAGCKLPASSSSAFARLAAAFEAAAIDRSFHPYYSQFVELLDKLEGLAQVLETAGRLANAENPNQCLRDVHAKLKMMLQQHEMEVAVEDHWKLIDNVRADLRSEHTLIVGALTIVVGILIGFVNVVARFNDIKVFSLLLKLACGSLAISILMAVGTFAVVLWRYPSRARLNRELLAQAELPAPHQRRSMLLTIGKRTSEYTGELEIPARLAVVSAALALLSLVFLSLFMLDAKLHQGETSNTVDHHTKPRQLEVGKN